MFPQTYGTRYYGKRFPIETEKQISAAAEGFAFVGYTKVFLLYLVAAVEGTAKFLPKVVSRKIIGYTEGVAAIAKKAVTFSFSAACESGAKITKHIIFIPIAAVCEGVAVIKKQVQKTLLAVAEGLASILKHRQLDFEFSGSFEPGDVVTINSKTLEVTLNGENALHRVGKRNWPVVRPGDQEIVYTDDEGERKVTIRVVWKDRWL